jgi:uncharacterized protein GlcG (DUF336 family)
MSLRVRLRPVRLPFAGAVATALLSAGATTSAVADLPTRPMLPLAVAQKMIDTCVRFAKDKGIAVHIAIKDASDHLVAFARMDDTSIGGETVALGKATTSARGPWSTRQVGKAAFDPKTGAPNSVAFLPDTVLMPGGLPIMTNTGRHLGGIGVSGSTADNDEGCAQAALDAVKSELTVAPAGAPAAQAHPRQLQDEAEIRDLLIEYGLRLDSKDYAGYGQLFARDGEWIGGLGHARGPEAIQALVQKSLGPAAPGTRNTNSFHLLTNAVIRVDGDRATAVSKWLFFTRSTDGKPTPALGGHYDDILVREDGHWKFLRRVAQSDIPFQDPLAAGAGGT